MDDESELLLAVENDAALRERLTETFNARGNSLGWFRKGQLRPDSRSDAFEFLMGVHAGLQATGLPGFNGMELTIASVRGADFVFPINKE